MQLNPNITWEQLQYTDYHFHIEEIVNDTEGIFVTLHLTETDEKIVVSCDGSLFSYRTTRQEHNPNQSRKTGMYEIDNSAYLDWIRKDSYGVYEIYHTMKHYVCADHNIIFEILTLSPPTIHRTS